MQSIVGFQQDNLKILNLNCVDAIILEWLVYFSDSTRQEVIHEENGKRFYWVKYSKVFSDLLLPFDSNFKLNQCFNRLCGNDAKNPEAYPLKKYIKTTTKGKQVGFSINKDIVLWLRGEATMLELNGLGFDTSNIVPVKKEKEKDYRKIKALPQVTYIFERLINIKKRGDKNLFPHKAPTDANHYEKLFGYFQESMLDLYQGRFLTEHKMETLSPWFTDKYKYYLKDCKKEIIACKGNWEHIKKLVIKAGKNYAKWFDVDSESQNKDALPKNINEWIYSVHSKTSMFYVCLVESPTTLREANAEKMFDSIPEKARDVMFKIYNDNWDGFSYWSKVKNILKWYSLYAKQLIEKDSNCTWWLGEGSVSFLRNYREWLLNFSESPSLGNIGIDNKTWDVYLATRKREHNITCYVPSSLEG